MVGSFAFELCKENPIPNRLSDGLASPITVLLVDINSSFSALFRKSLWDNLKKKGRLTVILRQLDNKLCVWGGGGRRLSCGQMTWFCSVVGRQRLHFAHAAWQNPKQILQYQRLLKYGMYVSS